MPEPITITQSDTPALSEENREMLAAMDAAERGEEQAPSLLAGKYKSVEELEKAYMEAQRKLSQPKAQEQEPASEPQEEAEEPQEESAQSAREIYGEAIGGRLEEAGIDFSDMNTRWQQSGELTPQDYTALEGAGFSREMVDAYLNGLQYQATQETQLAMQQVAEVKAEFGGDQGYAQMIEWAKGNLDQAEIDAFNEIVNGSSNIKAVKLAVSGLHAKYIGATGGREPRLIGGRAPTSAGDKFESTAQLVEAMKDPRYESDPAYRKKVEQKLARSSIM